MSQPKSVRGFCDRWKMFIKNPPRPKFHEEPDSDVIFEVTPKECRQKNDIKIVRL